jgi:hypothetical protein
LAPSRIDRLKHTSFLAIAWLPCQELFPNKSEWSKDCLTHNLYWNTGTGCICRCMPPQIVGPQPNSNLLACLFDHCSRGFVTNGENSLIGLDVIVPDVRLESVSPFLRDEYMLPPFSAFWASERQLPVVYIGGSKFQNFSDSHPAPGHEFRYKAVSWLFCSEDDLINKVFFDDFPGGNRFCLEHFS